jgi:two-component system chemotaxis sensor kinase CheA
LSAFLDDYFAECDEHLTGVRRLLLDLEASVGRVAPRPVLDELFRHFHSLKGISGMVELRPAEDLAHRMEEYLRSLRVRESVLTSEGLSAFFDGAQLLEQIVGARRSGGSVPAVEAGVARWGRRLATTMDRVASFTDPAESDVRVPAVTASPRWRLTFIPHKSWWLAASRDTIRKRLASIGEIVQATPHVIGEGTIAFEFVVATRTGEEAFAGWQEDGVTAERLPEEPPAIEPDDAGFTAPVKPAGIDSWSGGVAPSHFVRVDLARLDELMRGVGDLVISRARLNEALTRVESHIPSGEWRAVQENAVLIDRQVRTLREGIMRVRLVQVGEIFRRMPFVVRDLARETGKKVQLELRGQSAEIDKFLIERMMDPVLHLVRNAVSHGIETVEERLPPANVGRDDCNASAAADRDSRLRTTGGASRRGGAACRGARLAVPPPSSDGCAPVADLRAGVLDA